MPGKDHINADQQQQDAARSSQGGHRNAQAVQNETANQGEYDQNNQCNERGLKGDAASFLAGQGNGKSRKHGGHINGANRCEKGGQGHCSVFDHGGNITGNGLNRPARSDNFKPCDWQRPAERR